MPVFYCHSNRISSPVQVEDIARYFNEQVGADLPPAIATELKSLRDRVSRM